MKRGLPIAVAVSLVLTLVLGAVTYAQVKKDPKTGLDRIEGTIQSIAKDKSTLTVKPSGPNPPLWTVSFSAKTKVTMMNKPSSADQLKEGIRVIVEGKYENDGMTASRIEIRTGK